MFKFLNDLSNDIKSLAGLKGKNKYFAEILQKNQ
jgi:hypothetical protein